MNDRRHLRLVPLVPDKLNYEGAPLAAAQVSPGNWLSLIGLCS
jgi:hypothetical protein